MSKERFVIPFSDAGKGEKKYNGRIANSRAIIDTTALSAVLQTVQFNSILNEKAIRTNLIEMIIDDTLFDQVDKVSRLGIFELVSHNILISVIKELYAPVLKGTRFGFSSIAYDTTINEYRIGLCPVDEYGHWTDSAFIERFKIPFADKNKGNRRYIGTINGSIAIIDTEELAKITGAITRIDSIVNQDTTYTPLGNIESIDIIAPDVIYTVQDANVLAETMPQNLYIDHFIKIASHMPIRFKKTQRDIFPICSAVTSNQTNNVETSNIIVDFDGAEGRKTIQQVSTKSTVGSDTFIKLLQIGDSVGGGFGGDFNNVDYYGVNPRVYWATVQKLFDIDGIKANNQNLYKMQTLGFRTTGQYTITKGGTTYGPRRFYGEGRGTWSLKNYLYDSHKVVSEVDVVNPFYDENKVWTGDYATELNAAGVKFSLAHYIESYRTHDDSGNILTVGEGTGTNIHSTGTNNKDTGYIVQGNAFVCTPNYFLQENAFNDSSDPEEFAEDSILCIKAVLNEYPTMKIGVVFNDGAFGYFPEFYPEYTGSDWMYGFTTFQHNRQFERYNALRDAILEFNHSNVTLIPTMFVQPTFDGCVVTEVQNSDGSITKIGNDTYRDSHPNNKAHSAWAAQVYAWLKNTLA